LYGASWHPTLPVSLESEKNVGSRSSEQRARGG
jgi:hypothetical protein